MRHSFTARASMALLILTSAGASALAQQAAQSACYVPGSGTIYRIKEPKTPTQCATGHTEFQLAAGTKPSSGPTGPAGGDLGGSYPDPLVMKLQGHPVVNAAGSFDFSNDNGFASLGTAGVGAIPASGFGTRFMWYPAKRALRAGNSRLTDWDDVNIGDGSMALGITPRATGVGSIAMGNVPLAAADGAVAIGSNPIASGTDAAAIGSFPSATGNSSIAIGSRAVASGPYSTAIGQVANATGPASTAIGMGTVASGMLSTALGTQASTNGMNGAIVIGDNSGGGTITAMAPNQFVVRAQQMWFGTTSTATATAGRFLETSTGAYLTVGGAWTNSSDVNRKHAFERVDADSVLDKIAAMPVQTWSYKTENDSVRHMGPTAQDFRRAFGLGDTDKAIATVDADGVSLAGIKALVQRTTELRRENQELRTALADLYRRLSELDIVRR